MKIAAKMTTLHCFEKIRFCMKYRAKTNLSEYLLHVTVHVCKLLYYRKILNMKFHIYGKWYIQLLQCELCSFSNNPSSDIFSTLGLLAYMSFCPFIFLRQLR